VITLVYRHNGRPATDASAQSYPRWSDIPPNLAATYPRQGEEPTRLQSDLYAWSGEDEPDEEAVTLRVTVRAPVGRRDPMALLMAAALGGAEIEGAEVLAG